MAGHELRISSELLALAMCHARHGVGDCARIQVDSHDLGGGRVEYVARKLAEAADAAPAECFALAMSDTAIDAFVQRIVPITQAGFAGGVLFGRSEHAAIGVVVVGDGVDWLEALVEVRPDRVIRWPLNALPEKQGATNAGEATLTPTDVPSLMGSRRTAVVGSGTLAAPMAAGLFAVGLSTRPGAVTSDQASDALPQTDIVIACLSNAERHAIGQLRNLCRRRLRVLINLGA